MGDQGWLSETCLYHARSENNLLRELSSDCRNENIWNVISQYEDGLNTLPFPAIWWGLSSKKIFCATRQPMIAHRSDTVMGLGPLLSKRPRSTLAWVLRCPCELRGTDWYSVLFMQILSWEMILGCMGRCRGGSWVYAGLLDNNAKAPRPGFDGPWYIIIRKRDSFHSLNDSTGGTV